MSHFSVTVILDKEKVNEKNKEYGSMPIAIGTCLKEAMAKYDEQLEVEPHVYKTKEDLQKEYEAMLDAVEGKESRYSEEYCKEKKANGTLNSFETFMNGIYDNDEKDQDGNVLTTYNPNSKYDYYSPVSFLTKKGKKVESCKVKEKALNKKVDKKSLQKDYEELLSENIKPIHEKLSKFGMDALLKKRNFAKKISKL